MILSLWHKVIAPSCIKDLNFHSSLIQIINHNSESNPLNRNWFHNKHPVLIRNLNTIKPKRTNLCTCSDHSRVRRIERRLLRWRREEPLSSSPRDSEACTKQAIRGRCTPRPPRTPGEKPWRCLGSSRSGWSGTLLLPIAGDCTRSASSFACGRFRLSEAAASFRFDRLVWKLGFLRFHHRSKTTKKTDLSLSVTLWSFLGASIWNEMESVLTKRSLLSSRQDLTVEDWFGF